MPDETFFEYVTTHTPKVHINLSKRTDSRGANSNTNRIYVHTTCVFREK